MPLLHVHQRVSSFLAPGGGVLLWFVERFDSPLEGILLCFITREIALMMRQVNFQQIK